MNELYKCPTCGKGGSIKAITPLMSDVRYDTIECPDCGCAWRAYYKVTEPRIEVIRNGNIPTEGDAAAEQTTDEN